ncbi:MAG: hypothetical protein SGJ07_14555 [Rhodospirillaceae bacterium]|nr:hypothetical protein [Rhodospirillaceae bacterium]
MFAIPSLTKIFVLAAVVLAIWFGFRLIGRLDRERKQKARVARDKTPPKPASRREAAAAAAASRVEDLIECRSCGSFVPAKRTLCSQCGAGI